MDKCVSGLEHRSFELIGLGEAWAPAFQELVAAV